MNPKTILAVVHGEADLGRVLDAALPLAERFGAHLVGFHAEPLPIPQASPLGFPDVEFVKAGAEAAEQRSARLKTLFTARIARDGQSAEWLATESLTGGALSAASRAARAVDLVVAQQADPDAADDFPNAEALLFETGRPLLLLPYATSVDTDFQSVVVAWNGTAESARAAFDALPFIVAAKEVTVLCVDPRGQAGEDASMAGVEIVAALARHGAKVTLADEVSGGLGAGEVIENFVAERGADLLVMGAYGKSWLREFLFGGATRTLLRSTPVATLMSR